MGDSNTLKGNQSTNPGFIDAQAYRDDPTTFVPDNHHSEHEMGTEAFELVAIKALEDAALDFLKLDTSNGPLTGRLHVFISDTSQTANTNADDLVVENSGDAGITILSGTTTNGTINFGDSGDDNIGLISYDHNIDTLAFGINAGIRMTIDSSGKTGIGIATPDGTLHVMTASSGTFTPITNADDLIVENSGNVGITMVGGNTSVCQIVFARQSDNDIGNINYVHSTNSMNITVNDSTAVTIDSSQNMGLGIATPDGRLHVHTSSAGAITANPNANDLVVENSGDAGITILSGTTFNGTINFGRVGDDNAGVISYDHNLETLAFGAGAGIAITLDANQDAILVGNIQVGNGTSTTDGVIRWTGTDFEGRKAGAFVSLTASASSLFLLLAGRAGGQTASGGTAANEDLTFDSTTNAAKGSIILQSGGGNVSVGIAVGDGLFHIHSASAGSITANPNADELVLEGSGDSGMTILSGSTSKGTINFGKFGDDNIGSIAYDYNINTLAFTADASVAMTIDSAGLKMQNDKLIARDVNAALTASTTQTQAGGLALTAEINEIANVANTNDTVTMPSAITGLKIVIINNGANTLQIFPASGDDLGNGIDSPSNLVALTGVRIYVAYDFTNWKAL